MAQPALDQDRGLTRPVMIAVIDYGLGNLRSVCNAIDYCGHEAVVTAAPQAIADASHVVLPGVGAFGDAMANLRRLGLPEILEREVREKGKPFLGICLGMQVLARRSSEHGEHLGLGWFDLAVERLAPGDRKLKIPHIGWNSVTPLRPHPILRGLTPAQMNFYFVHGYAVRAEAAETVLALCDYGGDFVAALAQDAIVATQFHPEKSQDSGLQVYANFLRWRG